MIFNEDAGTNNDDGSVNGAHLTPELILYLPKPLVELPANV